MTAESNWGGVCSAALLLLAIVFILAAEYFQQRIFNGLARLFDWFYKRLHPHDDDYFDTY